MKRWYRHLTVIAFSVLFILIIWATIRITRSCSTSRERDYDEVVSHAMIVQSIEDVLKLSSGEIYQEVPIVDTIAGQVVAMVIQARTYIDFDLDHIPTHTIGDTLYVQLPPEQVKPYELGYKVVDVHPLHQSLFYRPMTAQQENVVKQRIPERLVERVYTAGYITEARRQARQELSRFLSGVYPHVVVVDRYPEGVRGRVWTDSVYIDPAKL